MGLLTEQAAGMLTEGSARQLMEHNQLLTEAAHIQGNFKNFDFFGQTYNFADDAGLNAMLESGDLKEQKRGANTLMAINNLVQYCDEQAMYHGESFVTANLGALPPRVLDVVRIFYPNQVINEMMDIQPIDGQDGTIFTMRPEYSNTFGGVTEGDEIFKDQPTNFNYASEEVYDSLGTGDASTTAFAGVASVLPMRPGTVKVLTVVSGSAVLAQDDSNGNIVGGGLTAGTVDYVTGAVSLTYSTAPDTGADVTLQYCYDAETNCEEIRSVEFKMTNVPVKAKMHPLTYKYSVPSGLAGKAHLGIDVHETLSQLAAQYIKIERDNKAIKLINDNATANPTLDFDATAPAGYQRNAFYGEIELKLNYAESQIQTTQKRGGVDFVLCGINASDVWKNVAGFKPAPVNAPIGPHVIGTLRDGQVSVIKVVDQTVLGADEFIFGYKGYMAGDAATILAEWIPVYFTPTFQSPRFKNEQGVMSMYDMFVNNPGYYVKGKITNYSA